MLKARDIVAVLKKHRGAKPRIAGSPTLPNYQKGWYGACECGWFGPPHDKDKEAAQQDADMHIAGCIEEVLSC